MTRALPPVAVLLACNLNTLGPPGAQDDTTATSTTSSINPSTTDPPTSSTTTSTTTSETTSTRDPTTTDCEPTPWYRDFDGDDVGDGFDVDFACAAPPGYVVQPGDCNDMNPDVSPLVDELCDGIDNDCDIAIDEHSPTNTFCDDCTSEQYQGSVYYRCELLFAWQTARQHCQHRGADLAILNSDDESTFLTVFLNAPAFAASQIYIGLSDILDEGEFRWVDNVLLDTPVAWYDGQPDNSDVYGSTDVDCVVLHTGVDGEWQDIGCSRFELFVCEGPVD